MTSPYGDLYLIIVNDVRVNVGVPARGVSGREGLPREAGIRGLFWADGAWCLVLVSREQTTERSPPVDGAQVLQVQGGSSEKKQRLFGHLLLHLCHLSQSNQTCPLDLRGSRTPGNLKVVCSFSCL